MPFAIAEFLREVMALHRLGRDLNVISKVLHWFRLQGLKTSVGQIDKCCPLSEVSLLLGDLLAFFMAGHSLCSLIYYLQFPFSRLCHLRNTTQIFHQLHQGSHKYVTRGVFMYPIMHWKEFGLYCVKLKQ